MNHPFWVALHGLAHSFVELVKTVVHAMKQGKLEVVKQEMARVNVAILGISKLKWIGMGEFNSDNYIYYCGQECLRRNGVAIIVNKSPKCSTWMQSQK